MQWWIYALAIFGGFCLGYVVRVKQERHGRFARELDKTLVACERDGIGVLVTYRRDRWRLIPRHVPMLPELAFRMFGDPKEPLPDMAFPDGMARAIEDDSDD